MTELRLSGHRATRLPSPLVVLVALLPLLTATACSTPADPSPSPQAAALLDEAERALEDGQLARAEQALRDAERARPPAPPRDIALLEAAIAIERGQLERARQRLQPLDAGGDVAELRARIDLRAGEFDRAQETFRDLAERRPESAAHLTDLAALAQGLSLYAEGRYGDAVDVWSTIEDDRLYTSLSDALQGAQTR